MKPNEEIYDYHFICQSYEISRKKYEFLFQKSKFDWKLYFPLIDIMATSMLTSLNSFKKMCSLSSNSDNDNDNELSICK